MDGKDHRALVRFLWGATSHDWNESALADFRIQMEDLQATRGYLISNGFFSDGAKQAAPGLGISLTDGPALKQTMYDYAPPTEGLRREPEKPLPFERYIPWFVGVSLGVVSLLVVILISIALSYGPAETGP